MVRAGPNFLELFFSFTFTYTEVLTTAMSQEAFKFDGGGDSDKLFVFSVLFQSALFFCFVFKALLAPLPSKLATALLFLTVLPTKGRCEIFTFGQYY